MNSRNSSANQRSSASAKSEKTLLSREEEYKRLNEELEAKTAILIKDAEQVFKEQESLLSKPSLLDNINTDDFLDDFGDEDLPVARETSQYNERKTEPQSQPSSRAASRVSVTSKLSNQQRAASSNSRPNSQAKKSAKGTKPKSSKSRVADDVAVPDDAFLTELSEFSLQHTIADIQGRLDDGELGGSHEDVLPTAAQDMGAEAQIRFLKAKLRVMQEELDRLSHECTKKDEVNTTLGNRLKEVEDDRNRINRTSASQQQQIDKYKKLADDAKAKTDSLETQLSSVKKELDGMKRSQKQQQTSQSATEVRLNRALEELDKYKAQLARAKSSSKESSEQEKRKVENLLSENRRLEKQKNELMTGFKKQLKLIDILKRQKMHIEAAKMLHFSEEEFVKALEWGS